MGRRDYGSGAIEGRGNSRWLISVEHGHGLDGKRRRQRVTIHGTKRDAQAALRERLSQRDNGVEASAERITLAEWLPRWLARHHAEGHISDRVRDRYEGIINAHLLPAIGRLRVQDLRADHIGDLTTRWLSGEESTADRPLSGATVRKHLNVLRRALSDGVRSRVLTRNPMEGVVAPAEKSGHEQRALMDGEIRTLVSSAEDGRFALPIRFTLATGVRQAELLSLARTAVDL